MNQRVLPWRERRDPYSIWVSEVMLQQTQSSTVIPYFKRWMERFPTVQALALASEEEVLALWQGLGYYRRGRQLHSGARHVMASGFPHTPQEWLKVPGVGEYTAGALCSIALGQPVALVDGNVARVYARLSANDSSGSLLLKDAWKWARKNVHAERPGEWNQALMELGATVCTPRRPRCSECPMSRFCHAFALGLVEKLPTSVERPPHKSVTQVAVVSRIPGLLEGCEYGVEKVPEGEWWARMWRFPNRGEDRPCVQPVGTVRHVVTNHRVTLRVFLEEPNFRDPCLRWVKESELCSVPMPAPQRRALELCVKAVPQLRFSEA